MGPQGPVGSIVQSLGLGQLSFSFAGLVVGSVIYSLPFVIQPMHHAFAEIGSRPIEVARTLGSKGIDLFASVIFSSGTSRIHYCCSTWFCAYSG